MAGETPSHIIAMPKGFIAVRIFQSIFACFVLGVNIYGAISAPVPGIILNIFTAIATIITLAYIRIATFQAPGIYQYWAVLSLEIFCLIFWLISFALLASEVAIAAEVVCSDYYDPYSGYYSTCSGASLGVIGLFGAAAGVGGIEFILFIVSLSMFSVRLAHHRNAGGHSTPGAVATAPATTAAAAPAPAYNTTQNVEVPEKVQMQPQAQVYPTNPAPQNGYYPPQGAVDARYGGAHGPQANQQYAPVQQQYPPVQQQYAPAQPQYAPTQQQYPPSQPQTPQQVPQQLATNQAPYAQYPTHAQQLPADPIQHAHQLPANSIQHPQQQQQ